MYDQFFVTTRDTLLSKPLYFRQHYFGPDLTEFKVSLIARSNNVKIYSTVGKNFDPSCSKIA